jgi:hypothetical protein
MRQVQTRIQQAQAQQTQWWAPALQLLQWECWRWGWVRCHSWAEVSLEDLLLVI